MTAVLSPTDVEIFQAIRSFIVGALPSTVAVVRGQASRVAEPGSADFVVMTELDRVRIETNVDTGSDCRFTGSISGTTMTVSAVQIGAVAPGAQLFGTGVQDGSSIVSFISGVAGGPGTYGVAPPQSAPSQTLSSGVKNILQPTQLVVQLDVHGPNSSDNAQILTTLLRDEYAVSQFQGTDVTPLHADDPRQAPFFNAEQQYETRWTVEAHFQVNQTVTVPQQFADSVTVTVVSVDATYPP